MPCLSGDQPLEVRPAYSAHISFDPEPLCASVRHRDIKYLTHRMKPDLDEAYDLKEDRREQKNVLARCPGEANELETLLERWQRENLKMRKVFSASPVEGAMDPDLFKMLKQLGY
jgi:hypothetical protein